MYKRITILAFIIAVMINTTAIAQPDTLWTKTFGGSGLESGYCVRQTPDGGFIVSGHTCSFGAGNADVCLIKTDASGIDQWSHTYGGTNDEYCFGLRQTADGGYIIPGRTFPYGAGFSDVYLIKTDSSGFEQWSQAYGGTGFEVGEDVLQTTNGGYIVLGYTGSYGAGSWDIWLFKTDSSGIMQWSRTYGGTGTDECIRVQQTLDGGYIIIGNTESYGVGGDDVYLIKTDAFGIEQWSRTFGGVGDDYGHGIQQLGDGGYIITGTTNSFGAGCDDVYLLRTDAFGIEQWSRTFGGGANDYGADVQLTEDGGYIVAGHTFSYGAGSKDIYLIRTDSAGNTIWTKTIGGPNLDYANYIQLTQDGGFIVIGSTQSYGAGSQDVYLVRLELEGFIPNVNITLTPQGAPINIPATGGSFNFDATLTNNAASAQTFEVWIMVQLPIQTWAGPVLGPVELTLPAGGSLVRQRTQSVPAGAPAGNYGYQGRVGFYPSAIWDSDSFPFTKLGAEDWGLRASEWKNTGESFENDEIFLESSHNSSFIIHNSNVSPNPFNPTTVISFELRAASYVKFEVFDVNGRVVEAGLRPAQGGWYPAGAHQITFNGAELPSGIYFAKLTAGDLSQVQKLVLLK